MKIEHDKYYTPVDVATRCFNKTIDIIGNDNIHYIVEPSCGAGAFCQAERKPDICIDILPEMDGAIEADYLLYPLPYVLGGLTIGNPPYGEALRTAKAFYDKATMTGDYIAFILPISQYNNMKMFKTFNLVYSEKLGVQEYSGVCLECCFNVYAREGCPVEKPVAIIERPTKLKVLSIYRQDSKGYAERSYDIRMCYWGNGSAGKILTEDEHYSAEYKIKIHNPAYTERVCEVLRQADWHSRLSCISALKIQQFQIIDLLCEEIKDIY